MCNLTSIFRKPRARSSKKLRWDNSDWDYFLVQAINDFGKNLLSIVPRDFDEFIIEYPKTEEGRITFWANIFVEMAYYESNFNTDQKYEENFLDNNGKKIVSRGLFQLSIESCRGYNCPVTNEDDLHDPKINIISAVMIMNKWVGKDHVIASRSSGTWRGGARYWSVLRGTRSYTAEALASIKAVNKTN